MDNKCTICHQEHNEQSVTLECGHKFHYKCIEKWYLMNIAKIKIYNKNPNKNAYRSCRTCCYCLKYGGYLPSRGVSIEGIHSSSDSESSLESVSDK